MRYAHERLYIVFQWTFIRPCNGTLSRRAECPLATYFINERPFRKPTAAIPVGSLATANAASAEFQRRKSKARYNPFSTPQKNEIARSATTTTPLHRRSSFETRYKTRISPAPLESIHLAGARLCNKKVARVDFAIPFLDAEAAAVVDI